MGKGEIARYEQFFLFPQCFQKACFPGMSKGVVVWDWVKVIFIWDLKTLHRSTVEISFTMLSLTRSNKSNFVMEGSYYKPFNNP